MNLLSEIFNLPAAMANFFMQLEAEPQIEFARIWLLRADALAFAKFDIVIYRIAKGFFDLFDRFSLKCYNITVLMTSP